MKNLFKNLMLVAVAAMAFTACSEDNNEVNKAEKKVVYEFVASFEDDTRSGFTGSEVAEDGTTIYHSAWTGGETVLLVSNTGEQVTATVGADGHFTAAFTGPVSQVNMYSPASAWAVGTYAESTIPAVQTSGVQSVDPAAHIVSGYTMIGEDGTQLIPLTLSHAHAYGKMTVKAPEGYEIAYVELDLKGDFYDNARENSYKLYASEETPNLFWFTTECMTVDEFTLTAYDAEDNALLTKTVNMADKEKPLAFSYANVSTFSVSLETPEEPATPSFSGAAWTNIDAPNDKLIVFNSNELGTLQLNFYKCGSDNCIDARTYGFAQSGGDIYPGGEYSWYKPVGAAEAKYVTKGSVEVTVVDGQYHFEFIGLTDNSGSYSLTSSFTGEIAGLVLPDTRTPLALPTNVTATAEGNIITIKWDAVEGADEYYVFCYEGGLEAITTAETSVTIEAAYSTKYSFLIRALANESNPDYKTNENDEVYFNVTTGKDPNVWADVILSEPTADTYSSYGFCFRMNITDNSGKYFRFFFNEADRVGNNSLNTGVYTGIGNGSSDNYAPGVGKFAATMFDNWGRVTGFYARHFKAASTIEVTFANNEYTIVLTHEGKTYGYKGMPEGWVAPAAGGDDNTGEGGGDNTGDDEGLADSYTFDSCKYIVNMDQGQGWGRRYELSNANGLCLDLWVDQPAANEVNGYMNEGDYGYQPEWCDYDQNDVGFVVKTLYVPSVGDYVSITNATMNVVRNNDVHIITFVLTLDGGHVTTITFNGNIEKTF